MKVNTLTYHLGAILAHKTKQLLVFCLVLMSALSFAQDKDKEKALQLQKANNYVYEGNTLIEGDDFVSAEMEYRKAISEQPTTIAGTYNLGNSYYQKGQFDEALYRHTQAAENASSKAEKHKAYHNIGNILMQNKMCKEAVEAFKNALRNDPSDDETRYNFAIAKECAEQQQDNQDENDKQEQEEEKEGDDEEKDKGENEEKEDENDKKDENNEDKKEGDDQKDDQGKPKDENNKKDQKEGDNKDQQGKPQPKQGQLSPQQIKNLLEAMNNQEQKVQDKINAEKQKGVKIKTEKDW
ncbi:tetratricopeptide repeat protein [Psychroserpens sp. S379A]|uniref:tetratricopeptide repeat protein n=1 Tax=Psychroserpens sp. S379A TaxID=3415137 RepID=UPI003C7B91AB